MATIGRVDFKKDILKFLKLYNTKKGNGNGDGNGNIKKIQKKVLGKDLIGFLNIFVKILIINCAEMLESLKLVRLTFLEFSTLSMI